MAESGRLTWTDPGKGYTVSCRAERLDLVWEGPVGCGQVGRVLTEACNGVAAQAGVAKLDWSSRQRIWAESGDLGKICVGEGQVDSLTY